ncbi:MAG: FAD-dependent oxidoreductase [Proteobacteria bacterium]|nr:FAD-dependent oxidoreductase [Pseudomonadota bacterium]
MNKPLPSQSRIVVIGGGAVGASIAYHLTRAGERDVVLLEKTRLTDGATWHAAGLVGQFRTHPNLTRLMQDSVRLFATLGAETGQETGWSPVGSLRVAASRDRWMEFRRAATAARSFGFEMQLLSPAEAKGLYPLLSTDGLVGAAFIAEDGHVDPYSLTQAFAKGIRAGGGRIFEGVMVTGLTRKGGRISHVVTDQGTIEAEIVVNAAGLWARQVGWMAGVKLAAGVVQHQFMVTEKSDLIPDGLPTFRDPDGGYYAKPEPGALAIGGWERAPPPVNPVEGFAWANAHHLFDGDVDRFAEVFEPAARRIPVLNDLGLRTLVNGPIPISPDGEPIMGPAPGLENFFVACAFTSGIAASGGAGKAMANWILEGDPGLDLWAFDVRRFGPLHANPRYLHARAVESYSRYYDIHWPGEEGQAARGARRSALYQTLAAKGAVHGSKFGWERPNWFAPEGDSPAMGWQREGEAETVGREHRAAREGVVTIDMSSFTKFEITGPRACAFLQHLAVANIDKAPGGAAYTQLCNARGGIEADVTIIRRAEDRFWLITGSALGVRDGGWLRMNRARFGSEGVEIRDITSAYGVINLAGPLAREVLERVADADVSHAGHPFMTAREINIGYAPALAYRVTYIGELGWELYIPTEYMQHAYETLHQAGADLGLSDIGYRAIDSLRLEKRFLAWGSDITPDYNPIEAGLGFLIDWNKDFLGAEALARIKAEGVSRKLVCLALDEPLAVFGGEAILVDGMAVGQTTSGNFGYTVGKSLVLGYLPADLAARNAFEVEAFGRRSGAVRVVGAAYDPERRKILI